MKKLAVSIVGIMAIITLEAAGCSIFNRTATYTEADTSITTSINQEFIIALQNPTPRVGNRWYESFDDTILSLIDTEYNPDDEAHPDFGGTQNYRFRPLKRGITEATFTYKTATDQVIKQKVFSIRIDSSGSQPETVLMPTPKPAETPPPAAGPEVFVLESNTVAIGTVGEGSSPIQQDRSVYRDWVFNVEEYVIRPLPEATFKIRILEEDIISVKGVHLREGEHLLVFLKKEGDHFIFAGGLLGAKFAVNNGRVQNAVMPSSVWALNDVVARIKATADTWSGETLTPERRIQVQSIALDDSSVKELLTGKEYEIVNVSPYLTGFVLGEARYAVEIESPNRQGWETHLVVVVNATREKVDRLILNVSSTGFMETDKDEAQRIALADKTIQEIIGNRGYEMFQISRDYWEEMKDGKTLFHIYPVVELFLYPRGSENLDVFVDLNRKEVVKIFTESNLSPTPLESSGTDRDFTLTISIPKTEYRVGETAEAIMTLKYTGSEPIELSSPGGEYFNLFIRDRQNNMLYRWRDDKYPPGNLAGVLPLVNEMILPGWSVSGRLQFRVPEAGTLYLKGLTFNDSWGYQVSVTQGSGGYGVNADTPFLVIKGR